MKQKRHKPEEIIRLLREADRSDLNQEAFCIQKPISIATLHRWRKKYGLMSETDAKHFKALEKEMQSSRKCMPRRCLESKFSRRPLIKSSKPRSSPRPCQTNQEEGRVFTAAGLPHLRAQ